MARLKNSSAMSRIETAPFMRFYTALHARYGCVSREHARRRTFKSEAVQLLYSSVQFAHYEIVAAAVRAVCSVRIPR